MKGQREWCCASEALTVGEYMAIGGLIGIMLIFLVMLARAK